MTPISGDWNNDGIDEIGIYDPNTQKFYLRSNNDVGGSAWKTVKYGSYTTNIPITGDWNGDGTDEVGVYNPTQHMFYLRSNNDPSGSIWKFVRYGATSDNQPIIGDWNGLYISCAKVQTGRTWKPACYFRCLGGKINGKASASTIGKEIPNPIHPMLKKRHCEPFVTAHSEPVEECTPAQDKLRVAISVVGET